MKPTSEALRCQRRSGGCDPHHPLWRRCSVRSEATPSACGRTSPRHFRYREGWVRAPRRRQRIRGSLIRMSRFPDGQGSGCNPGARRFDSCPRLRALWAPTPLSWRNPGGGFLNRLDSQVRLLPGALLSVSPGSAVRRSRRIVRTPSTSQGVPGEAPRPLSGRRQDLSPS